MAAENKTLATRMLDKAGLAYDLHAYPAEPSWTGEEVAAALGLDPERVFKTLVTQGKSGRHFVFMVPVGQNLNLKKAALVCGEKALEMLPQKELLPLTGYVHGGCSPLAMKKSLPSFIDETALLSERIVFNAGRVGLQLEMKLADLQKLLQVQTADLV
jgi:Cys-tRNA(Pro)/Cys-tRNA(Cys) deacylase